MRDVNTLPDTLVQSMAAYALAFKDRAVSTDAAERAKELILDTLGVAVSGWREPSIGKIYRAAEPGAAELTAHVFGTGQRLPLEWAVICNGSLVRVQDYMDVYYAVDASHPAEYIPFVFSCCDALDLSGEQALSAILLAYDLQGWFTETMRCNLNGWHYATVASAVCAVVLGVLMGCSQKQIENMAAINCSCNYTNLGSGAQTDMKTLAFALAAAGAVKAARLAAAGIEAPADALENLICVTENAEAVLEPLEPERPRIFNTSIKPFPSEFMAHSASEALENILSRQDVPAEEVESVDVAVHNWATWIARDCSYHPQNREEADHSLPYCIAARLVFGRLTTSQFQNGAWLDSRVTDLMGRITVHAEPELERLYPKARPAIVTITLKDGTKLSGRVDHPLGDSRNPMSYGQVRAKFERCVSGTLSAGQAEALAGAVREIENRKISEVMELMKWTVREKQ